jgi:hypothetical protein
MFRLYQDHKLAATQRARSQRPAGARSLAVGNEDSLARVPEAEVQGKTTSLLRNTAESLRLDVAASRAKIYLPEQRKNKRPVVAA